MELELDNFSLKCHMNAICNILFDRRSFLILEDSLYVVV